MGEVYSQLLSLSLFIITGIVIGILFDIFRVLRKCFKTADFITYLQDIVFWFLAGMITLFSIFKFNQGEIRIYVFLGIFIGILLYAITLSKIVVKFLASILQTMKKLILIPLQFIYNIFQKIIIKPISNFINNNIKVAIKTNKKKKVNKINDTNKKKISKIDGINKINTINDGINDINKISKSKKINKKQQNTTKDNKLFSKFSIKLKEKRGILGKM